MEEKEQRSSQDKEGVYLRVGTVENPTLRYLMATRRIVALVGAFSSVILFSGGHWLLEGAYLLAFLLTLWWVLQVACDWMDRKAFNFTALLLFGLLALVLAVLSPVLLSANRASLR